MKQRPAAARALYSSMLKPLSSTRFTEELRIAKVTKIEPATNDAVERRGRDD